MRSLGFEVKDEELKKMVSDIDGNGNGMQRYRLRRAPHYDDRRGG